MLPASGAKFNSFTMPRIAVIDERLVLNSALLLIDLRECVEAIRQRSICSQSRAIILSGSAQAGHAKIRSLAVSADHRADVASMQSSTCSGVMGCCVTTAPKGDRASFTAFQIAADAATAPASPTPRAPSVVALIGVSM